MAKHFGYYDDWKSLAFECPTCDWKGAFDEGAVQYFKELMDCSCPKCETMLAIVSYPTVEDTRANWSKLSDTERERFERIDKLRLDLAQSGEMEIDWVFKYHVTKQIDSHFDESSLARDKRPRIVIIMGGVASGKTTLRRQRFSKGCALVDAAEIFLGLCGGESLPFPDGLEGPMEVIGNLVAQRAVSERRHIVTELVGADLNATEELIRVMRAAGYEVVIQAIDCDVDVAMQRNAARGEDNISCYYAEPYHRRWILEAATAASNPSNANV